MQPYVVNRQYKFDELDMNNWQRYEESWSRDTYDGSNDWENIAIAKADDGG